MSEWEVQGLYDLGWECVYTGEDKADALQRLLEYRRDESATPFRVRLVRETDAV